VSVRVLDTGVVEFVQDRSGDRLAPSVSADGEFGLSKIAGVGRPHSHLIELAANWFGGVTAPADRYGADAFGRACVWTFDRRGHQHAKESAAHAVTSSINLSAPVEL